MSTVTPIPQQSINPKPIGDDMKQVINGKLYNTETARTIAEYSNHDDRSNFSHYSETLYGTKNGRYFLLGDGGAMSKYSYSPRPNESCGDTRIVAMTEGDARIWLEAHASADEYQAEFEPELA